MRASPPAVTPFYNGRMPNKKACRRCGQGRGGNMIQANFKQTPWSPLGRRLKLRPSSPAKASSHRGWRRSSLFRPVCSPARPGRCLPASIVARLRVDLSIIVRVRMPMLTLIRAAALWPWAFGPDGIQRRVGRLVDAPVLPLLAHHLVSSATGRGSGPSARPACSAHLGVLHDLLQHFSLSV